MPAAPDIDELGAARQLLEEACVQNAAGLVGQRQQADQDLGLREEIGQRLPARIAADTLDRARRAVPACKREAEMFEPLEHGLTEQAEPHDSDAAFRRLRVADLAPALLALLGDEGQEVTM